MVCGVGRLKFETPPQARLEMIASHRGTVANAQCVTQKRAGVMAGRRGDKKGSRGSDIALWQSTMVEN